MKEIVFVDCDLTLVKTDVYPLFSTNTLLEKRKHRFLHQWKFVATEARPTAAQFLEELNKKYKVHILSLGHSEFQTRVLTKLGLIDMVDKIWGPDNVQGLSRPDNFVLIDDMAGESLGIAYKMTWMGRKRNLISMEDFSLILADHFIQCRPYAGGLEEDAHLTDFLPVIDNLMQLQTEKKSKQLNAIDKQDVTVRTTLVERSKD